MGVNDRIRDEKDKKGRAAEEKRRRRNRNNVVDGGADWSGVDGTLIAKAIAALAKTGGALRLGYTRDGGAYAVGIYGDGEPFTEYIPPSEDIEAYLRGVIEDYE